MRAARQPAEQVFCTDDRRGKRLGGAVQGGADESSPLPDQRPDRSEKNSGIGDVLDNFERQDRVEALPGAGHRFGTSDAVIDR